MVFTIYKPNTSPPSRAVLMIAELLGLKIKTQDVNSLARDQFKPEFLEKNPAHRIPVLEDGDFVLADSHAIITYLVSNYAPEQLPTLYPTDLKTRATIDNRLYLEASILFPSLIDICVSILKNKASGPSEEQIVAMNEVYGFFEKYLDKTQFLAADHITVADVSVVSTISSSDGVVPVDVNKFPKIMEWWKKIKAKDWYQKANVPGQMEFDGVLKSVMKRNSTSVRN